MGLTVAGSFGWANSAIFCLDRSMDSARIFIQSIFSRTFRHIQTISLVFSSRSLSLLSPAVVFAALLVGDDDTTVVFAALLVGEGDTTVVFAALLVGDDDTTVVFAALLVGEDDTTVVFATLLVGEDDTTVVFAALLVGDGAVVPLLIREVGKPTAGPEADGLEGTCWKILGTCMEEKELERLLLPELELELQLELLVRSTPERRQTENGTTTTNPIWLSSLIYFLSERN